MFNLLAHLLDQNRYMGFVGILTILTIAFVFSNNKKRIRPKLVINALLMQILFALFIVKTTFGNAILSFISRGVAKLYDFANVGSSFVFGKLTDTAGPWGLIFAIKVATIIIFFGALMAILFHFKIIQFFVKYISFAIRPVLGTSGAETLCATAKCILGQTEAPLLVKNYLPSMTDSEIFVIMVSGMATISGAILAVYGAMGVSMIHMFSASVMAIPGAILVAKILYPEVEKPKTMSGESVDMPVETSNVLDAVSRGTTDGLKLAVNILAMLITFISLIAMINYMLSSAGLFTLNDIFAKIFSPIAFLLGVPSQDVYTAGSLLGQKLVINEFVAYSSFVKANLADRTQVILTYALCGFANFSSIGIQIGGIGALCPTKRHVLIRLGFKALLGGTLVNLLNAAIISLII
ncbi:TPA: NupC/NupG family nucleoside CNT transporter [Candidatus Dependentiae bacterium]|nr:MAG: Nucleoside transporter, NupC family [candidate division TM6 bacterium GW2011_GWE2_31_21]KKP54071.1 MAG: Nucleoside transporter, NupC family [candidate division TM6 bacterium GW2011_GWF2_33_332]HBS48347.1 NupC/NupG family nucleoside CNT transporter [Candidatus Dependentiae bacterium]HBZ72979.1 NupC/NupG family nucleoside CNT transporter [Candidatus Dependentiae bacterium]